ncbi:defensin-like [Zeugodacus cucurbitae]|uniref:defensin-like n=1 Tax=Zeugodacus cucurbitae TaxID=28588 RepID=UPI0005969922|nr:defensin-like [Zeugodacus cucurbitae]
MANIALFALSLCLFCICAASGEQATPDSEATQLRAQLAAVEESPVIALSRQRRFTCNSWACKAHCIALGRGNNGYCNRQHVCSCR